MKDLERAKRFYNDPGFETKPEFSDDTATNAMISEHIVVMLLTEERFKDFITGEIADATKTTEVLNALSADSREAVDELADKALPAGAQPWKDPIEEGPMYGRSFQDPTGTSGRSECLGAVGRLPRWTLGANRDDVRLLMASCCNPRGCDRFFTPRLARRVARRYRRRGLDKTARRMVGFLEQAGIEGATVLEVGGGVGEIQIELLKRGAERSVNLELSPAYEGEAERLPAEAGLEGRVQRRLHDIAVDPDAIEPADVVVLHRVVCCYPDYERLLAAAAARARRLLVFSYPRRNAVSRSLIAAQNVGFRIRRREFRTFAHPPSAMLAVLGQRGLDATFAHSGIAWQVTGLAR